LGLIHYLQRIKAKLMSVKFTGLTPTIGVGSLDEAIDFYSKLGFEAQWKWPESNPTHSSLKRDGTNFMIQLIINPEEIQKGDLYFWVQNIQEFHQSLKDQGLDLPHLSKTEYGMLDTSLNDPWGHHLTFGEPQGEYEPT
jgi:catechol 2,3-dioxygenase-like lactoylglutathione lyase family enzyme